MHPAVKVDLRKIWQAETRAAAEAAVGTFAEKYGAKYGKAVTCLTKDREALLACLTTFRPLIGTICAPVRGFARSGLNGFTGPIPRRPSPRSRAYSPPSAIAPSAPRAPCHRNGETHGFQAGSGRGEEMAPAEGREPVASRSRRRQVQRRHCQPRCRQKSRRLISPRHPDSRMAHPMVNNE